MDRAHVVDAVLFDKLVKSRAAELEESVGKGLKQPEAAVAEIRAIKYRFMHDFRTSDRSRRRRIAQRAVVFASRPKKGSSTWTRWMPS